MRALAVLVVALAGCGGEVVDIEIRFPSQETFLRSESARVFRFGVRPDQADLCPALLQETSLGQPSTEPDWDSGLIPVCDLHAGLSVPVEGAGHEIFIVLTENEADQVLLAGCTVSTSVRSGTTVRLAPTPDYVNLYVRQPAPDLSCKTPADKCAHGCN